MKQTSHGAGHGTLSSYAVGFVMSLALTLGSYLLVSHRAVLGTTLIAFIIGLAIVQLVVQLVFFLHFGRESQSRWNLAMLLFAILIVCILVGGSLWIMANLNRGMTPGQVNSFISNQDGL